jgi:hypothetical protein
MGWCVLSDGQRHGVKQRTFQALGIGRIVLTHVAPRWGVQNRCRHQQETGSLSPDSHRARPSLDSDVRLGSPKLINPSREKPREGFQHGAVLVLLLRSFVRRIE